MRTTTLAVVAALSGACGLAGARRDAGARFDTANAAQVDVETASGDVTVKRGAAGALDVAARIEASAATPAEARALADEVAAALPVTFSNGLLEVTPPSSLAGEAEVTIHWTLTVPGGTDVVVRSAGGAVDVSGLHGDVAVDTASGDVHVAGARTASLRTASGALTVADVDGSIDAASVSGDVSIASALGPGALWQVGSVGGAALLTLPGASAFDVRIHTTAGAVSSDFPVTGHLGEDLSGHVGGASSGLVDVTTVSGDVRLRTR